MGRHKLNKDKKKPTISCTLNVPTIKMMQELAEKMERPKSYIIEKAIMRFLTENSKEYDLKLYKDFEDSSDKDKK